MVIHQLDEHGEDVPQVAVLVHRGQIVQNGLQFILLHTSSDHHQFLHKVQDERPDGDDVRL